MSVAISHLVEKPKTAPRVTGKLWVDVRKRERLREHLEAGGIYSIELIRGLDNVYAALVIARRGLGFHERIPKKIQRLISPLIASLSSLLPALEAKGKREIKRLLNKLRNWRNIHSWSFWHTFNQSLRKVGVKPWLLRDINLLETSRFCPCTKKLWKQQCLVR